MLAAESKHLITQNQIVLLEATQVFVFVLMFVFVVDNYHHATKKHNDNGCSFEKAGAQLAYYHL